ncbi:MAG: 2-oxoacid:acceptor oxidoreductase subunit alpha, partial [Planctomycetota bacterium]
HQLSTYRHHGVLTFQAEDEIAAVCAAIGASYVGKIAVTSTSGPGLALKSEAIGLAVMTELPLVVIDVQRGGPSTGMPTKTEQADLLQAMFGRNGESPVAVIAATGPSDAFDVGFEAVRVALKFMTPVLILSDGAIANGSEPWLVPDVDDLPPIEVTFPEASPEDAGAGAAARKFMPYERDPQTLARHWAVPGTKGLQHRIGGLEKEDVTGNISYDPLNHEHMVRTRAAKVARIAQDIPAQEVQGDDSGDLLILGWGSTRGSITGAVNRLRGDGKRVSGCFLRWLNPFPSNLEQLLRGFRRVLIPEMNCGQLAMLIRSRFLIDAVAFSKVQGRRFYTEELVDRANELLREMSE